MSKFKDKNNREWNIVLDVGMIEDIKDQTGIDLDEHIANPEKMAGLIFDGPRNIVAVLHVCLEDQIKSVPLTPREFAKSFDRATVDAASNAFLEAMLSFYPRSAVGGVMRENLPTMLEKMDQSMMKEAKKNIEKVLSNMHTD